MASGKSDSFSTSRRRVLEVAMCAAPLSVAGGAMQLLQGCSSTQRRIEASTLELGAREAIEHIRNGDMTAEAYAARLLEHSKAHKDLNAIVTIDEMRVLEGARAVDKARARDGRLGPASGLPFAVKDQIDVAGYPTTGGNGALKANIPRKSATVVDAVIEAGGIVFAKTNLPDMVAGSRSVLAVDATYNPFFGGVRNPYDPTRIPGGSSGGNGAALGARMVPAAIGEDTTGSVRFPAAFCGIAGLRPSTYTVENALHGTNRKRYSDAGIVVPPADPRDTFGPMARTVADVAFLDSIITGEATPVVDLRQVRIAIPRADYWDQEYVDQGLARVILAAFDKLRDAGARLVEIDFNAVLDIAGERLAAALRSSTTPGRGLAQWLERNLPGVTLEQVYEGRDVPAPRAAQPEIPAQERVRILTTAARQYADVFRTNAVAAIAFPTIPIPAPPIDPATGWAGQVIMVNGKPIDEDDAIPKNLDLSPRLGAPGLCIPAGLTAGLPVGLELEGLPGDDARILGLGIAVENVLGRIPPPPLTQRVATRTNVFASELVV